MTNGNWNWNTALITGGAGGLGLYFAEELIKKGKKVIIAGRTESKLVETMKSHPQLSGYLVVDVGNVKTLPKFVEEATTKYSDIDCIISNAGIQKPTNILKQSVADYLADADQELDINIKGTTHLIANFLPHLLKKSSAAIITVSSGLGFLPAVLMPTYSATKAYIRSWTQTLRISLKDTQVRVIEVVPPLVESDLHRDHPNPDGFDRKRGAQTPEEFIIDFVHDMNDGLDTVAPGAAKINVTNWDKTFGEKFTRMNLLLQ